MKVRMGEKEILQAMKQSVLMLMAACQESEGEDDESDEGARLAIYCTRACICCCCRVSLKRVCSKEQSWLICACICTILDPMGLFVRPCVTQR